MYQIKTDSLPRLYAAIAEKKDLFLPVKTAGQTNFGLWTETAEVDIRTLKTVKSAKDIFFPQSENLYRVSRQEGKYTVEPEALQEKPFVVFGIRGCDVKGMEVLDKVFLLSQRNTIYLHQKQLKLVVHGLLHLQHGQVANIYGLEIKSLIQMELYNTKTLFA